MLVSESADVSGTLHTSSEPAAVHGPPPPGDDIPATEPAHPQTQLPPPYTHTLDLPHASRHNIAKLWMQKHHKFEALQDKEPVEDRLVAYLQLIVDLLIAQKTPPNSWFENLSESRARAILRNDKGLVTALSDFRRATANSEPDPSRELFTSICLFITRPAGSFHEPVQRPVDKRVERLIRDAWETPLLGAPDIKLIESLQVSISAGSGEGKDYANSVTMLQSSGTGKTRSAHEASKWVVCFPVILRPGSGPEFPKADVSMRDMMSARVAQGLGDTIYPNRFRHTIRLLSSYLHQWLELQTWTETAQPRAYWEKASAWNLFLETHRKQLYDAVAERVQCMEQAYCRGDPASQADAAAWPDAESERARTALVGLHHTLAGTAGDTTRVFIGDELLPDDFKYVLSTSDKVNVRKAVDGLVTRWEEATESPISRFWSMNKNLLVLAYFDEAHVLLPTETEQRLPDRSLYDYLLSVLNDLSPEIFGLFLSTSSHLHQFAPPADLSASARQANSKFLQPPITEVPFDCMAPICAKNVTLKELGTVAFLAKFGRLLFWTILKAKAAEKMEDGYAERYVMRLAVGKLSGKGGATDTIDSPSAYSEAAHIAVMHVRYLFDYEPLVFLSAKQASQLVAKHMCLVYGVPVHRLFMFAGYSSEPILAEAAARLIREWMWDWSSSSSTGPIPTGWSPLAGLASLISRSMLDYGGRGELVTRYLFVSAYDRAMVAMHPSTTRGWLFSEGCPVKAFFEAFFVPHIAQAVLSCLPDNVAVNKAKSKAKSFGNVFGRAYVRFTHFVRLKDTSGLTTHGLAAAFIRGMAFIAKVGQALVDLIFPVLLDSRKAPTPDNMSCILVQVKRRIRAGTPAMYDFTAEQLGVFEDSDPKPEDGAPVDTASTAVLARPYITLLLELGVKAREIPPTENAGDAASAPAAPTVTQTQAKGKAKASDKAAPKPNPSSSKPPAKTGTSKALPAASPSTSNAKSATKSGKASKAKERPPPAPSTSTIKTRSSTKAQAPAPAAGAAASTSASATTTSTGTGGQTVKVGRTTSGATIPKGPEWQSPRRPKPHPRYNIRVYGCSEKVYGIVSQKDRLVLEEILLVKHTIVEKHPRKNRTADMLLMKPFWTSKSFHWIEHPPQVDEQPGHDMNNALVDILEYEGDEVEGEDSEDVVMDEAD